MCKSVMHIIIFYLTSIFIDAEVLRLISYRSQNFGLKTNPCVILDFCKVAMRKSFVFSVIFLNVMQFSLKVFFFSNLKSHIQTGRVL